MNINASDTTSDMKSSNIGMPTTGRETNDEREINDALRLDSEFEVNKEILKENPLSQS
jgi:hypothetical protein